MFKNFAQIVDKDSPFVLIGRSSVDNSPGWPSY